MTQAARGAHFGVNRPAAVLERGPQLVDIITAQPLQVSVGNHRGAVVAHHAVAVPGTGPLGQETALEPRVHQPFLHPCAHRGIHQVNKRHQGTEGVPEPRVGKHPTGQHLAVIRAVVDGMPVGIDLVEAAGKQYRAVQA